MKILVFHSTKTSSFTDGEVRQQTARRPPIKRQKKTAAKGQDDGSDDDGGRSSPGIVNTSNVLHCYTNMLDRQERVVFPNSEHDWGLRFLCTNVCFLIRWRTATPVNHKLTCQEAKEDCN